MKTTAPPALSRGGARKIPPGDHAFAFLAWLPALG